MEKFLLFVIVIFQFFAIFCLYLLHRNNKVFEYRRKVSDIIFEKDDWAKRLEIMEQVSYEDMMKKFWKPLNSFYSEDELLN